MKGEDAREKYFTRQEKAYEKQVAGIYADALSEIRVEMSKIYEKYAVNGILTRADMTKYNRLTALEKNMQAIIKEANKQAVKTIDKLKPTEYAEAFFRTAWAFDMDQRIELTWGPINKAALVANLDNPFYQEAVKKFGVEALSNIRTAINNGLALGQSYTDMMKDLKDAVNLDAYKIMRILRTELHDAQEAGTNEAYADAEEMGIKGKVVWIATLDGKTRPDHQAMDGVARDEDGYFRGAIGETPYPGWDGLPADQRINCRCTIRFEIEGLEPELRRSKEDGVIDYQTYDQWSTGRSYFK